MTTSILSKSFTRLGLAILAVQAAFWVAGRIRVSHILYMVLGSYLTLFVYQLDVLSRVF